MKKTIVMVDDNDEFLDACASILNGEGFEVASFTKVIEAKKYLCNIEDASSVHAIISDLIMGPVDGLEFLAFVKTTPSLKQIDFFIMTGTTVKLFEPYYSCYPVKGVIEKPCTSKTLISIVLESTFAPLAG